MKTFGFTIKLRDQEAKQRYFNYHKSVWPEVHDALDSIGVRSAQIFFIDDCTLFMHMESLDEFVPSKSFPEAMKFHPRVQWWDDIMHKELLVRWRENTGSTEWAEMKKIYHYDTRVLGEPNSLKSYGFFINFKNEECVKKYEELHQDVWPEVKDAFERMGIKTLQLFYMPRLKLFMYIEANHDFVVERDFKEYVNFGPKVREWDDICGDLLKRIDSNDGITDWAVMEKIYAYDRREHRVIF